MTMLLNDGTDNLLLCNESNKSVASTSTVLCLRSAILLDIVRVINHLYVCMYVYAAPGMKTVLSNNNNGL